MRLWSIHPEYLDSSGLVALWREALLAKNVLMNKTRGYKNHPQLTRFKKTPFPVIYLNWYLKVIWDESVKRDFNFNRRKIGTVKPLPEISVSSQQIKYEFVHLLKKLKKRDIHRYHIYRNTRTIKINPVFSKVTGVIEKWEKL